MGSDLAVAQAAVNEAFANHALTVTCKRRTKTETFSGVRKADAVQAARDAGWVYDIFVGKGSEICPVMRPATTEGFRYNRSTRRRHMSLVRNLSVLMALPLIAVVSGEQLPPVYFNHIPMFVDQAILDDLMASRFLQEEFSTFQKRTTQRDGGKWSYTGVYAFGQGTYLEFLPGAHGGEPLKQGMAPLGTVEFGMWMDERDQLPLIRDSLAKRTPGKPEIRVQTVFQDGHDLKWFDATSADFPDNDAVRTGSFVMAMYGGEDLRQRIPDLKPEEDGTTRERRYVRVYSASKLMRAITRITLTVSDAEEDRLVREFASYGYPINEDANKKIATGPEFELVMLSARDNNRKLAISMKLNRAKEGPQVLKIGTTSELRFDSDSAVWYFPNYW